MKQKTRILIYILIGIVAVIIGTIAIFTNQNTSKPVSAQEKIDLGRTYLLELSFDKAVFEFTEAIEIEPMNADAYLGLAEAYVGMNDIDKAIETLELGYERTGDVRLKDKLDELILPEPEKTTVTTTVATTVTTATTTVSTMEMITVPDLSGLTKEEAISMCEEIGIIYNIKTAESDSVEKNYVISQSIPGGNDIPVNYGITINISEGAPIVTTIETTILETTITKTSEVISIPEYITIRGVQYSTKLTELDLRIMDLTNEEIRDLDKMINLTYLNLARNKITDISVLKNLTNLEELVLTLESNNINALSNLTNLKYFSIIDDQLNDISALSKLTNLTELYIYGSQVSDISVIKNFTNITKLGVWYSQVSDISVLSNLTNLTNLDLRGNQISDISALKNLTNLTRLNLEINQISDISVLKGLTNLEYLNIGGNPINKEDIEKLKKDLPNCEIDLKIY